MNKKYVILISILALLVVAYVLSEISFMSSQKTFDPDILKIDSASIAEVILIPAGGDSIFFENTGSNWKLRSGSLVTVASPNAIANMLNELKNFKIDRLASDTEKDLEQYQLTDSLESQIIIRDKEKNNIAHLHIGKVSFLPRTGNGMYGGQRNVDGITYFCLDDSKTIYAAMSFIGMMATMPADNWRDHTILQCEASQIKRVSVKMPGSEYVLAKDSMGWKINDVVADSTAVQELLNNLSFQALNQFENVALNTGNAIYSLQIESVNQSAVTITGSQLNDSTLIIRSTANPEIFRAGMNEPFIQNCFKPRDFFEAKKTNFYTGHS